MIKFPLKITLHCKFWLRLPGKSLLRIRLFPKIDTTHKPTIFFSDSGTLKNTITKTGVPWEDPSYHWEYDALLCLLCFFFYKFKNLFFQRGPCTWERPEDTPAVHQVSFVAFCHLFIKIDGVIEKLKISVLKRLMIMWIMFFSSENNSSHQQRPQWSSSRWLSTFNWLTPKAANIDCGEKSLSVRIWTSLLFDQQHLESCMSISCWIVNHSIYK